MATTSVKQEPPFKPKPHFQLLWCTNDFEPAPGDSYWYECQLCYEKSHHKFPPAHFSTLEHQEVPESPVILACELCPFKDTNPRSITTHNVKAHLLSRMYVCAECPFVHKDKGIMGAHLKRHLKTDIEYVVCGGCEVKCGNCDFQCKDKETLEQHLHLWHETEEYKCGKCDFRGKFKWQLEKHNQTIHNVKVKLKQCDSCQFKCRFKSELEIHILLKH